MKDELEDAVNELGTQAGAAIGGAIGQLIAGVIVWVVNELIDWLVTLFDNVDDPISTQSWIITLQDTTQATIDALTAGGLSTPAGITGSQMKLLNFRGDGGRFEARLHWRATM